MFLSKVKCRLRGAQAAARCMGIDSPKTLGIPDGRLHKTSDLQERNWAEVESLRRGPVAAILSSDEAGLYGHPDHMAVHDAVVSRTRSQRIPLISTAVPELLATKVPIRCSGGLMYTDQSENLRLSDKVNLPNLRIPGLDPLKDPYQCLILDAKSPAKRPRAHSCQDTKESKIRCQYEAGKLSWTVQAGRGTKPCTGGGARCHGIRALDSFSVHHVSSERDSRIWKGFERR